MTPTRPKPFSESERERIERIKALRAAEAAEKAHMDSEALWKEARDKIGLAKLWST